MTLPLRQLLVASLVALLAAPAAFADVGGILRRARITPLTPTPASDFTLPDLAGGDHALADHAGNWVLLTFWATWCGPCKTEMPTLQALHEARSDQGFQVVAVSIDRSAGAAQRYVTKNRLSFLVLHDGGGKVASAYQASAVPVSYLIDPAGQLVGVSRGARDWGALTDTVDALLAAVPADPDAEPVLVQAPVQLAPDLVPPTASVRLATAAALHPLEPFTLDVAVQWAGTLQDYLLHPPTVHLPDGVELLGTSASTDSAQGRNEVTYHLDIRAAQPGSYALDPVELRFTPHLDGELQTARILGPTVDILARPSPLPWLAGAASIVGVGLVGLGLWSRRRRDPRPPAADPADRLRAALDTARERRVAGDAAGALRALLPALEALGEADPALADALERARYGGQAPTRAELDRLTRRVERALSEQAREAAQDPLADIRYADDEQGGD